MEQTLSLTFFKRIYLKATYFGELVKVRLTLLVALSAAFGYTMAATSNFTWYYMLLVMLGAFLTTGAANALNQVMESELDALMLRTHKRPLPTGKLQTNEALIFALIAGIAGVFIMGRFFNLPAALLSVIALLSYSFVYTPLKRITPFCVFIGAIPGALPPLIGWVAVTGALDAGGLVLFAFQFFWQFPHFWAIAWILDEDYKKAGFNMLPVGEGRNSAGARLILIYTLVLVPLALLPFKLAMVNPAGAIAIACIGILFCIPAFLLYKKLETQYAKKLMLTSFIYLPVLQLLFLVFS